MRTIDVSLFASGGKGSQASAPIEIPDELVLLEGKQEPKKGNGVFRILSPQFGDQRVTWDSASLQEINAAKKLFLDLVKQGLTPYKVGLDGKKTSEVMREFEATSEEIIFVPTKLITGG